MPSLPPVSAKVIADAEQFIAEFKRAERAARSTTDNIGNEVNRLSQSLSKKFSLSDVGKSIMGGFGLGSGFAIIDTVVGKVTEAYKEHEAQLKKIDDTWQDIIKHSQEYYFAQMPDPAKIAELETRISDLVKKRDAALTPKETTGFIATPGAGMVQYKSTPTWGSPRERQDYADITKEIVAANEQLEALKKKQQASSKDAVEKTRQDLLEISKLHNQTWASMEKNYMAMLADLPESAFDARRDAIEDMFYAGKIGAEAASKAIKELDRDQAQWTDRMTKAAQDQMEAWAQVFDTIADAGVTEAMQNNEEYLKDVKDSMVYFADGVDSFLTDAIARGKDFGDVISDLGNSIISTFLKLSVINPIMNSLFGGAKGWTALPTLFGGFFADGGRPPVGRPSMVGENGPEMFVPDTPGTIVPNHALGGQGGDSFSFTYNISSGVTKDELMPVLKMQERSLISRIIDAQRRGKQLSPAF